MPSIPVTITGVLTFSGSDLPGDGARPEHPIAPGGPPPSIWPSPGYPAHPIAPGGPPPTIWPSPGHPEHPIAPGGPPPTIWPSPGHPAHPIAPGGPPPTIWPGPGPLPHPEHPIAMPPKPEEPVQAPVEWKTVFHPTEGWVVVGVPNVPHPVPSE